MSADDSDPADARAARLRELRALAAAGATRQELAIQLAAAGYDTERAAALLDQLAGADPAGEPRDEAPETSAEDVGDPGGPTLRVWAPFERARFSPEAWGQLLRLRADGMGDGEFEHLVDRALLQLEGPVGVSELRALLGDAVDTAPPPTVH
ncbi:hypothetical protein tb265_05370 [Gemmatimonadetes bacterium T265]|nr:hypothetical protein tb265_05370 [Gemmatimonadetes bacterium T265]